MTLEDIKVDTPLSGVRRITICRPAVRNALRTQTLFEIAATLEQATASTDVGAIVLAAEGKCFAAGADLAEMEQKGVVDLLLEARPHQWARIARCPKPVIVVVQGPALGAGLELVMHGDMVVASTSARFGLPEIRLGIIPGAGGTQRLTRTVGKSLAMQMVLTGEPISAETAHQRGLVTEVLPEDKLMDRALAVASAVAARAPLALRAAKQAVLMAEEAPLSIALELERKAFVVLAATQDRQEGIAAFLEKREPSFRGH